METSEKKLGCLAGTLRFNVKTCGYIEGSVNTSLKSGYKSVSVKDDKVLFWIVNDYDVTVTADDVASYDVVAINTNTREKRITKDNKNITTFEHTSNYNVIFTNGTSGILKVPTLTVCERGADYNLVNKEAFRLNKCPKGYVPEVAGWLNPAGQKDDNYKNVICPENYTADIVGFRQVYNFAGHEALKMVKLLGLAEFPLKDKVIFGGEELSYIRV